jgi:mannose-6-phosphate isomerase-like protein (cupin superfamily)
VLGPGEGRTFAMGRLSATFKADGVESAERYSISEWWLDPFTKGPGPHSHPEDDVFYVVAGTMSLRLDADWVGVGPGSFVLVPGGVVHDFENRHAERAGMLNVSVPGNFEEDMPAIAAWFVERTDTDADTRGAAEVTGLG